MGTKTHLQESVRNTPMDSSSKSVLDSSSKSVLDSSSKSVLDSLKIELSHRRPDRRFKKKSCTYKVVLLRVLMGTCK